MGQHIDKRRLDHIQATNANGVGARHVTQDSNAQLLKSICHASQKIGHFNTVCRSKQSANAVDESDDSQANMSNIEIVFLDAVNTAADTGPQTAEIQVDNFIDIRLKLDTDADVCVVSSDNN